MVMALSSAIVTLVIYVRKKLINVSDGLLMMTCSTVMGLVGAELVRDVPKIGAPARLRRVSRRAGNQRLVRPISAKDRGLNVSRRSSRSPSEPLPAR